MPGGIIESGFEVQKFGSKFSFAVQALQQNLQALQDREIQQKMIQWNSGIWFTCMFVLIPTG